MNRLICIRGHQGSGKSTLAKELSAELDYFHYEADQYWYRPDGRYSFNPEELGNAHRWCRRNVEKSLLTGSVVVANTSRTLKEVKEYERIAKKAKATFIVVRCVGEYQNVHGVPQEKVDKVKRGMQEWPGEIIYNTKEVIKCLFQ